MSDIEQAAAALRDGGLVVLPTETVYGLAANAADAHAVARVYAVKGRPADHPLILHIGSGADPHVWARDVPDYALRLAESFWPGPMTLVLRRSDRVGGFITGGQDTVAIRVPDHPKAQGVLTEFGSAVAAPSANVFGHVSPTTAAHAVADLGDRLLAGVDVVVDGGPCRVGVESTIVDCTGDQPRMLRPGSIGARQIESAAGIAVADPGPTTVRVSGSMESHYAPRAAVRLVQDRQELHPTAAGSSATTGLLALAHVETPAGVVRLAAPLDAEQYARVLYHALREADELLLHEVVAVPPPGNAAAAVAVRDRLQRAGARRASGR